jgi:hypothetical protein
VTVAVSQERLDPTELLDDQANQDVQVFQDLQDSQADLHQSVTNQLPHHAVSAQLDHQETMEAQERRVFQDDQERMDDQVTMDHQDHQDLRDHQETQEKEAVMEHVESQDVQLSAPQQFQEMQDSQETRDHQEFQETAARQEEMDSQDPQDQRDHQELQVHQEMLVNQVSQDRREHPASKENVVSAPNTAHWMVVSSSKMDQDASRLELNLLLLHLPLFFWPITDHLYAKCIVPCLKALTISVKLVHMLFQFPSFLKAKSC